MELLIIIPAAFAASILTFFSGFGLGTILTPVFVMFFPIDISIALTGVVHFSNNIFKIFLVGKDVNKSVLLRFGLAAILASFAGAWLLLQINELPALMEYQFSDTTLYITPIKAIIAILLIVFAIIELTPFFSKLEFNQNKLVLGGILSGFFGGLAGIQGAIRSAFLIRSGLSKEAFIATSVVIASLIDITRLSVYSTRFWNSQLHENIPLVLAAVLSAIAGAYIGKKILKKVTMAFIQKMVAILLILISVALGLGFI